MNRNLAIDLFRILMILGICLLHAISECGHRSHWTVNILLPCVNGFAFISGWFGVSFSLRKIWKLLEISVVAGGTALLCAWTVGVFNPGIDLETVLRIRNVLVGQWYLCAYVLLVIISPILNLAIDRVCSDDVAFRSLILPFSVLVLWNWAPSWPILNRFIPTTPGLGVFTCCSLVVTYVVARVVRLKRLCIPTGFLLAAFAFSLVLNSTGYWSGCYASPIAVVQSGSAFLLFERYGGRVCTSRLIAFVAPSCFSIYLFHSHEYGRMFIDWLETTMLGGPWPLRYLVAGLIVFLVSLVADMPRRFICWLVKRNK